MYYFLKVFTILTLLNSIYSQLTLPGSQKDDHDCVLDGGYEWCERTQTCQRSWESPCDVSNTKCPDISEIANSLSMKFIFLFMIINNKHNKITIYQGSV